MSADLSSELNGVLFFSAAAGDDIWRAFVGLEVAGIGIQIFSLDRSRWFCSSQWMPLASL
jgi:hypothetical protein